MTHRGDPPSPGRRTTPGPAGPFDSAWTFSRAGMAVAGLVPVTLIALSMFGLDLRESAIVVLPPVALTMAAVSSRSRAASELLWAAVGAGLTATALYDVSRFGFMWIGVVNHDPIPHIGTALGLEPAAVFGYLWRYLGNGTGLALTFLALGRRGRCAGVVYGLAVGSGLLVVLAVSPHGQELMFPLTPATVLMAGVGHAIYGCVIGSLSARSAPASEDGAEEGPALATRPETAVEAVAAVAAVAR